MDSARRCFLAGLLGRLAHLWQRLLARFGWGPRGLPTWGEGPPTILGVCCRCGAVVLEGWHQQTPDGLLCQRCAAKKEEV